MKGLEDTSFVTTVKERCRVCYTCVRECPAKAIRISDGQAEILGERCINCGNCVRVCSQQAKRVVSAVEDALALLRSDCAVSACIAPSFPAEFIEVNPARVVGALRTIGFRFVHEVAFGADLVAERYRKLLDDNGSRRYISTPCPAIISFVEKYHPDLVPALAPIVSPMVAIARYIRRVHGPEVKVVFIGPCIAKKREAASVHVKDEVQAALTFGELRELFELAGVSLDAVEPSDFDPPHAALGALFPISRGLLQAADIEEDLMKGEVVAADGRTNFVEAIKEFAAGALDARLLEILACTGCIMGPGMTGDLPLFGRRSRVSAYVRERMKRFDERAWRAAMDRFPDLDLSRTFSRNDRRSLYPSEEELLAILHRMGKFAPEDELNCGACGYESCREHAVAIYRGLAESEMCLPYTIQQLRTTINELAVSNERLANMQEALVHAEKLASMGQLAAGIAHEINNPLGIVLMYVHILLDEIGENSPHRQDLEVIVQQADRCKTIISGLLNFARQSRVAPQPTNIRDLVERTLKLIEPPAGVSIRIEHEDADPMVELDRDQIVQVITNLVSNAYAAMPDGGELLVRTGGDARSVWFSVKDSGVGIPKENLRKVFEPFFTTKQIGKGTGLGLAVTYGIVKMHQGDIKVESNADPEAGPTGSEFTVILPRQGPSG